ncbi:SdpI/YhfL family protein [Mucilaginibacter gracilis]|uniref:SdpI/YhfL family protein n=1 Tax=Mucilaginibacter gracilis TaxID=423350 RepID=A0A495IY18_9SPHI|nr:SdpI family protein [Mucilaginibacter gracilis]RKR81596.1 SdpI/YhfL family protein [Mucilaginibacter gracilis]
MVLTHWLVGPQLVGLIILIVGLIQKYFPPKRINNWYGYRTDIAKKSQQNWDYAQAYSANLMLKYGSGAIILGLLLADVLPLKYELVLPITAMFSGISIAVMMLVKTETHLEKKFNN